MIGDFNIHINSNRKQSKHLREYMWCKQLQEVTRNFISRNKTIIDRIWINFPLQQCHAHILIRTRVIMMEFMLCYNLCDYNTA